MPPMSMFVSSPSPCSTTTMQVPCQSSQLHPPQANSSSNTPSPRCLSLQSVNCKVVFVLQGADVGERDLAAGEQGEAAVVRLEAGALSGVRRGEPVQDQLLAQH
eukprot:1841035-Rhodomonas_salina.3